MYIFLIFLFLVDSFAVHPMSEKGQLCKITSVDDDTGQKFTGTLRQFIGHLAQRTPSGGGCIAVQIIPSRRPVVVTPAPAQQLDSLPQSLDHCVELEEFIRREIEQDGGKELGQLRIKTINDLFRCACIRDEDAGREDIFKEQWAKLNGIKGSIIQERNNIEKAKKKALEAAHYAACAIVVLSQLEPEEASARQKIEDIYDGCCDRLSQIEQVERCPIAMADLADANVKVRRLESALAKIKEDVVAGKEMLRAQQEEISSSLAGFNLLQRNMRRTLCAFKRRMDIKNNLLRHKNEQLAQLRVDFAQTSAMLDAATRELAITVESKDDYKNLLGQVSFEQNRLLQGLIRAQQGNSSLVEKINPLLEAVMITTSGFLSADQMQLRQKALDVRSAMVQDSSSVA